MKHTFKGNFAWQLSYLPAVIQTIAPFVLPDEDQAIAHELIVQTSEQVDMKEAADLIVTARPYAVPPTPGGTVAVRLRRKEPGGPDYADLYPFDFTIRRSNSSNTPTEAHKIMKGYGDWMFYGHARGGDIIRWMFLSLDEFRRSFETPDPYKGQFKTNSDGGGETTFVAFDVRKMPDDLLIECSWIE